MCEGQYISVQPSTVELRYHMQQLQVTAASQVSTTNLTLSVYVWFFKSLTGKKPGFYLFTFFILKINLPSAHYDGEVIYGALETVCFTLNTGLSYPNLKVPIN